MRFSFTGVVLTIGAVGFLGSVISAVIRHVKGPMVRVFSIDGLSLHCLSDTRGIRVVCNDQVVFATGGGKVFGARETIDVLKSAKNNIDGKRIVVRYRGVFPGLTVFVDGARVTSWPFGKAHWWARFFAVSWPKLCLVGMAIACAVRSYYLISHLPIGR